MTPDLSENLWTPQSRDKLTPETGKLVREVLGKIPQLPVSVSKIIDMAVDIDVEAMEIAEVAASDPVLVSKILMTVNSSYYGLNRKIDNIRLAIVLLGFNEVRNIAIRSGFQQSLGDADKKSKYDTKSLWLHSYLVSVCAETFLGETDPRRAGVLVTMGVLHDIGKFALYSLGMAMKKEDIKIAPGGVVPPNAPLLQKEEHFFGVNHALIGSMLSRMWDLPERISTVIEYHHFPSFFGIHEIPAEYLEDVNAICLADLIVNRIMGKNKNLREPHPLFFDLIGLTPPLENLITEEITSRLSDAMEFVDKF